MKRYQDPAKRRERSRRYRESHREQEKQRRKRLRENGEKRRPYDPESLYRQRARNALARAIARGQIVKPSACSECGWEGRIHGHHSDYSKPFQVEWLCQICHGKRHRI